MENQKHSHAGGETGGLELGSPPNPPRGTCIAADNSVSSVKAALATLCIFRTRKKTQCLCVSVFKKNILRQITLWAL